MNIFAKNLITLAPDWVTLPPKLIETFDWIEAQGWHHVREAGQPEDHWLSIYPSKYLHHPGASIVVFGGSTLKYTDRWSAPDREVDNRIFEFGETSADGGRVAIWLDNAGQQQFIQMGHDSLGIISDDPAILLQFLAMGYPEPALLEQTDITPLQAFLDYNDVNDLENLAPEERPVAPLALQEFLKLQFGLDMPATARDIGITDFPQFDDPDTTDPFARWIASVTPPPTETELEYHRELMRTVEALDIKDDDTSDAMMQKLGSLFKSKD